MAYSMMRMVGAQSPAPMDLRLRLNEYEALHELAHCRQAQLGYPFSLPGLTAVENARLSEALAQGGTSPLAALFRELYADAYAMHRVMAQRNHSQQTHGASCKPVWATYCPANGTPVVGCALS